MHQVRLVKLLLPLLFLCTLNIVAQNKVHFCATDQLQNRLFHDHPDQKIKLQEIEDKILERNLAGNLGMDKAILTIPVVVHIIHENGSKTFQI